MRKIVHIIDSLSTGGAEVLLIATIRKMPDFEHHIILLEQFVAFPDANQLAHVHCIDHKGWHCVYRSCQRIKSLVKEIDPFVVHAHLFLASFLTRVAIPNYKNLVYSLHTLFSEAIFKKVHLTFLEKKVYRPHHKLIAVSDFVLKDYQATVTECKSGYVLYNFIEDKFFNPENAVSLPSNHLNRWIAVGSLKEVKNYWGMLYRFEHLMNVYKDNKALSLDIYGEGAQLKELEQYVRSRNLPIQLKGKADNICNLLKQYDAYISTSKYEGYGIAPMEALACGVPLFLSDIPVYREVYKEHATYFSVADKNVSSFCNVVNEYMKQDLEQREQRINNGMTYALNVANSGNYIHQLLEIYKN